MRKPSQMIYGVDDTPPPALVCGVNGLTLELFEIGGFLDMLTIAGTREEAITRANAAMGA